MLNQRAAKVLQLILSSQRITIKQLEDKLNCTRRQVNYDIERINDWLESNNLETIVNIRGQGLVASNQIRNKVYELLPKVNFFSYIPSHNDRLKIIFIQLFIKKEYISVNHLTDLIKMSRNTVLNYVHQLKNNLEEKDIKLIYNRQEGYNLEGGEFEIRALALKEISYLLQLSNGMQLLEEIYDAEKGENEFQTNYQSMIQMMNEIERELEVTFVDEQLNELTLFFQFLFVRIETEKQKLFPDDVKNTIKNLDTFKVCKNFISHFPLRQIIHEDEIVYMTMHLLGLNTNHLEQLFTTDDSSDLYQIVDQIILDFEKLACITFPDKKPVKKSLFLHLKPAYYRLMFKIPITNPHVEKIKQEYFDLFILVKKSLYELEKLLNCSISDEEIGYITLHFGAFLKNQGISFRRRRCIIICPNGVSTSYMLKKQMEHLIPEVEVVKVLSPREYERLSDFEFDFILSTVPIKTKKSLIIVSPILTALDKAKIIKEFEFLVYNKQTQTIETNELMSKIRQFATIHDESALYQVVNELLTGAAVKDVRRYKPVLNQLLTEEMIQISNRIDSWQQAIQIAAEPLIQHDYIEERYVEAMITNIKNIGPYIVLAPKVAIPHARPEDGVRQVGMSLLKIDYATSFSEEDEDKDVNLIFVIAAVDNETHLKALSQLTELLEDEEAVEQIIEASSTKEILPFINEYSK
ncbi:BglG family transcription antiterminator [Oceanobacillus oncorhynchi]|uniref:BglG family transcription antiterminator n=1 Tax=Oceanobacillus oncorhynchi TaxID=545501 RepID=UPI0025A463B5|nr:BglG family transcription antiterminator [Oceanobacillus oncorhynchi]MDM8102775.1 BglG family transcription antiterminator [Oceanobacillus oncorhynchi]